MSNPWFRFYSEVLNDPKVQRLDPPLFKFWVNLLCVANQNDGDLPPASDISFHMRLSDTVTEDNLSRLHQAGLLDYSDGEFSIHSWKQRQYKSDNSSDRVKKYRDKRKASGLPAIGDYTKFKPALVERDGPDCVYCGSSSNIVVDHLTPISQGGTDDYDNLALACKGCNAGKAGRTPEQAGMKILSPSAKEAYARYVTVTVTPPDTDTDTEQIQKESAEASSAGSGFEEFWKTWKSLKHSTTGDSKKRALAQWKRLKPPEREMAQSRALAYQRAFKAEYGPDCTLKHAERYLRDKCFEDVGPETPKAKAFEIFKGSEEYEAWYSHDQKLPYFEKGGSHDWYGQTRVLKPSKFPEQERKSA